MRDNKQLQAQLEEVAEAYCVEYAAQKVRKVAKAKTREKAEKWRLVKEKEKKKWLEYLKQLWNKILAKNATLLGDTKTFQIIGSKRKKVTTIFSEDEAGQWLSKRIKGKQSGKYHRNVAVKIGGVHLCERYMYTR